MSARLILGIVLLSVLPATVMSQEAPPEAQMPMDARALDQMLDNVQQMLDDEVLVGPALEQALEAVRRVLAEDPQNMKAVLVAADLLLRGGGAQGAGDFDRARSYFGKVLEFEPSNFRANLGMGRVWMANRHWRQAAKYLETAERIAPKELSGEVKQLLASAYAGMGNVSGAVQKAMEATQEDPDNLDALQVLVSIRLEVGRRDPRELDPAVADAGRYVKMAAASVEEKPWLHERLIRLEGAYQLELQVLREYQRSLFERDPHSPGERRDRLQRGREAEAASALLRLAEKVRRHAVLRAALAEHDALMMIEQAVEYEPEDLQCLEAQASAYMRTQNRERAIEVYQRILELHPNHSGAREQLEALGVPLAVQSGGGDVAGAAR